MIRVLVADDHPLFREGVRRVLERTPEVQVVAEVESGDRVADSARETNPDVVLLDVSMPGPGHLALIEALKQTAPRARVLVLSGHDETEHAIPALRAGASGYLMKSFAAADLVEAVRRVYAGRRYVSPDVAEQLAAGLDREAAVAPHLKLSSRELEVLTLIASGKSLKEIAAQLGISPKTVTSYRSRILEKLAVKTNAELVRYALQHDLVHT